MIVGIGTDIINNNRIKKVIDKYGDQFKKRCFTINEINRSEKKFNLINSYAKRYAAKEACAKALGTGLARGVFWKDIEIKNNFYGKPYIVLHNKALDHLYKIADKKSAINVTLSDEKDYSIANVIIYKNEK